MYVARKLSGGFGPLEDRLRWTEQLQGLRMLKLRETLTRWQAGRLSQLEAAEILGMSERSFRRWARQFEANGDTGQRSCGARGDQDGGIADIGLHAACAPTMS